MKQIDEIRIEITNVCNTDCVMCPRELMKTPKGFIDMNLFQAVIDEAIEIDIPKIVLCGFGEPFTDKRFPEMISYLRKKRPGQNVSITSNGSLITEKIAYFLADCHWINSLRISVSGFRDETYAAIMKMSRERIYDRVGRLYEILKEKGSPTRLRINGLFIEDIFQPGELDEYSAYWREHADLLEIWKPHNWTSVYDYRGADRDEVRSCGRPANGPVEVMWNGAYKLCCFDFDGWELLGNYRDFSLKRFWELPRLKEIQAKHEKSDFTGLICEKCDQICSGKDDVLVFTNSGHSTEERILLTSDFSKIRRGSVSSPNPVPIK